MVSEFITAFVTIFVVMDPLGVMPLYLAMSAGNTAGQKRSICRTASIVSGFVLTGFALAGNQVMIFFHITIPAMQVTGGIILFVIAMQMLQARRVYTRESPQEELAGIEKEDISIVPLAIPLLAGPGTITSVLVLAAKPGGLIHVLVLLGAIWANCMVAWVVLGKSGPISGALGTSGFKLLVRLMGLLLAVVAVQLCMDGITAYIRHMGSQ